MAALDGPGALDYDGARPVILPPLLLSLTLATVFQDPPQVSVTAGDRGAGSSVLRIVEERVQEGLGRLGPLFPGAPNGPFRVVVHSDSDALPADVAAVRHRGSPGLAMLRRSEIHLFLDSMQALPPGDLGTVIDHELVHILLDQFAGSRRDAIPRWFHEGLAQVHAGGTWNNFKEEDLVFRVVTDSLLRFSKLEEDFPDDLLDLAYGQSYSFVAFLHREFGQERLLDIVRAMDTGADFNTSLVRTLGAARITLEKQWGEYLLFSSGALFRVLFKNCFYLLIILVVPILALAVRKRLRRERSIRERLAREDAVPLSPEHALDTGDEDLEPDGPPGDDPAPWRIRRQHSRRHNRHS